MLPAEQAPTEEAVNPTATQVGAWDVRDTIVLSLTARNTGAEAVTMLPVHARVSPAEPFVPSWLEWQPSTVQPGESARVDVDAGAQLEVAAYAQAAGVGSTLVVTARRDTGRRR